jgi:hypothetical protein
MKTRHAATGGQRDSPSGELVVAHRLREVLSNDV